MFKSIIRRSRCTLSATILLAFFVILFYIQKSPPGPPSTRNTEWNSHWKLYGVNAFNNVGVASEDRGERTKLFVFNSRDKQFQDVASRLESHPISCSNRPLEYQNTLSNKLERFIKVLAEYATFHAHNRGNSSSLKLVWTCGFSLCGGLADRLRGLTYTFILALLSQRVLLVDWSDSQVDHHTYLQPNVIDWRFGIAERKVVFDNLVLYDKTTSRQSVIHLPLSARAGTEAKATDSEYRKMLQIIAGTDRWVVLRTNLLPSGLMNGRVPKSVDWIKQGMSSLGLDSLTQFEFNRLMGVTFRYLFSFSKDIVWEIEAARTTLGLAGLKYVGVHVRTGFVGTKTEVQPHHYKLYPEPEKWKSELECARSVFGQPNVPIFLATDSNRVKDMAVQDYKDQVRSLDNSVIHVDNVVLSSKKATNVVREGLKTLWVELVLLAEAHTVVIGHSGYSFLAESLCLIPNSRVLEGVKCQPLASLS